MIDLHAHVLPGLDDGPADEAAACALLAGLEADGVTDVVAAPHTLDGCYNVGREQMQAGVERMRRVAAEAGLALAIHPGAEVLVRPDLPARLERGELTTIGDGGRYLLVEMAFQVVPGGLGRLFFELQVAGVVPVLAHPERTAQVQRSPELLDDLVAGGALLQINAASLAGDMGAAARRAAFALVDRGAAHLVASDAHHAAFRPPRLATARALLADRVGEAAADELVRVRPGQVLAGETVVPPPPARARRRRTRRASWWRAVFSTG